jgi:putative ABC transport system permease protein
MPTLLHDLQHAARGLRRNPGFTAAAVVTLALGIAATTTLFSVVHGVLLRSLPFPEPDRLVRLHETDRAGDELNSVAPPNFASLRQLNRVFTDIALYSGRLETLTGTGEPQELDGVEVSAGFFELLGVSPILGRTFGVNENQPGQDAVAVLSHGAWQRLFGADPAVLGRSIVLHGRPREVVGVMPSGFDFPDGHEVWVPIEFTERFSTDHAGNRRSRYHNGLARLRPGVTPEQANAELTTIAERLEAEFPEGNTDVRFAVTPLLESVVGGMRLPLVVSFAAVCLVLLIACANVAGLLLARAASRRGELALRAALGASPGRLVRELVSESLLLATVAGALGCFSAWWAVEALVTVQPAGLPRVEDIRLDAPVLAFAVGLTLLTGLLAGLVPAVRATRGALSGAMREGGRGDVNARGANRVRGWLVMGEIALAVVLLVGAGLLLRSLLALASVETGFRSEQVLTFRVAPPAAFYDSEDAVRGYYDRLFERISSLPGVASAAAVSRLPIGQTVFEYRIELEGMEPPPVGEDRAIRTRFVTPAYFEAMGIPVRRGRGFSEHDRGAYPVAIVNEAAARRYYPGQDPLGRRIQATANTRVGGEIVGIVGNARQAVHEEPQPEMYVPHAQFASRFMTVVVRTAGDPLAIAGPIRRELQALDADVPIPAFRTLDEVVSNSVARPRFLATIVGAFAGMALIIAATGVFGLLSFAVARQTREIGIRMALGARQHEVLGAVLRHGLLLSGAGLALGIGAALILTRLLQTLLYGVSPADPATLVLVGVVLGATALLASYLPARRAARVDPIVALRNE